MKKRNDDIRHRRERLLTLRKGRANTSVGSGQYLGRVRGDPTEVSKHVNVPRGGCLGVSQNKKERKMK